MSDNTMPERLWAQYNRDDDTSVEYNAWHTHDDKFTETEYIRADVAQAQLDAANARIAELEAAQAWVSVGERLRDAVTVDTLTAVCDNAQTNDVRRYCEYLRTSNQSAK